MKGQVLDFNGIEGIILGEDGKRYKFNFNQKKEEIELKWCKVDFEVSNNKVIKLSLIDKPKNKISEETKTVESENKIYKENDFIENTLIKIFDFLRLNITIDLILMIIGVFLFIDGIMTYISYISYIDNSAIRASTAEMYFLEGEMGLIIFGMGAFIRAIKNLNK
jgi:hypothetical protein